MKKLPLIVFCLAFCVVSGLAVARSGVGLEPAQPGALAPGVSGVLEIPAAEDSYPAVVLLHGASGWRLEMAELASILADSGFVALALDYYADVGGSRIGSKDKLQKWPAYQSAVTNAVNYLESLPASKGRPVGLVGFSRGAFLAVSVASSIPNVQAVVGFYGGGGGGQATLEEDVIGLPPLLIIHGSGDTIVPVEFAYRLRDAAVAAGGEVELHIYPDARHVFNLLYSPTYSETEALDAHRQTMDFLKRRLMESGVTP